MGNFQINLWILFLFGRLSHMTERNSPSNSEGQYRLKLQTAYEKNCLGAERWFQTNAETLPNLSGNVLIVIAGGQGLLISEPPIKPAEEEDSGESTLTFNPEIREQLMEICEREELDYSFEIAAAYVKIIP